MRLIKDTELDALDRSVEYLPGVVGQLVGEVRRLRHLGTHIFQRTAALLEENRQLRELLMEAMVPASHSKRCDYSKVDRKDASCTCWMGRAKEMVRQHSCFEPHEVGSKSREHFRK